MYLECINDSNNVNKIKAIACIKIKSAWHTYYSIDSARMDDAGGFEMVVKRDGRFSILDKGHLALTYDQ